MIDCGVEWRTNAAREKGPNDAGAAWLQACDAQRMPQAQPTS